MPILHSLFYMITNKATVKLPLFDTTSVCGNYNFEVRGLLCDGTETIETLNWDRNNLGNVSGVPSLVIANNPNNPITCTIGTSCFLEVEVSRATNCDLDLRSSLNNQAVQFTNLNLSNFNEELNTLIQVYDLNNLAPTEPGGTTIYLLWDVYNNCNLVPGTTQIDVNYEE